MKEKEEEGREGRWWRWPAVVPMTTALADSGAGHGGGKATGGDGAAITEMSACGGENRA